MLIQYILPILLFTIEPALSRPQSFHEYVKNSCGYDSCHPTRSDILNVHIVPHTHDDVGWLKTVDQYYYGSRTSIQKAGVQYIIDSVIDELLKDENRRFVYVESSFFERWWLEQNERRQNQVKQLVSEGRLEFAGGAWSMNDEAAVHYQSVVDHLTWGLRLLNDTFGECGRPKAGWQIDPFGHSRELAGIWASAGFDGLLIGRIDYQDKRRRIAQKEAEMIWRGSDDLGTESDILTGAMYNTYSPPPGFCFDILCSDDPIIDDIKSPDYNVDKMVDKFVTYVNTAANGYRSNNLIITMGGDFTYQDALVWYKNLDKLIKYVNERQTKMQLIYSTPGCYLKSLHDANVTWPTKQDDFFPYSSDPHAFWTGYFTSRPNSKYFERRGNNFLQICKQLFATTKLNNPDQSGLYSLRSTMGIMQHHDAITGTEKQHVTNDYHRMLEDGFQDCLTVAKDALNELMVGSANDSSALQMKLCQLNMTQCDVSETSRAFVVTVYNPLCQPITDYIRLPVIGSAYSVKNSTGLEVDRDIVVIGETFKSQLKNRESNATHEIIFRVDRIPPLGYKSYFVEKTTFDQASEHSEKELDDVLAIENENIQVSIDDITGLVSGITIKQSGEKIPLTQQLAYYRGMRGNNSVFENRASGAYIFRPDGSNTYPMGAKPINSILKTPLVEELHQRFSDWASQVVRVYKGQNHVEFEWLVGPIPIEDGIGKEVVSKFTTNFKTDGAFYTDSNGRQLLKRVRNQRPTWDLELEEPISGNYYPVTSMITIKDSASTKELHIVNDRAQGGGSLRDGEVELMVHRRLLYDDAFGVEEPLNETINGVGIVARGTHYLVIGESIENSPLMVYSRQLALKKLLQLTPFIAPANNLSLNQWLNYKNVFEGLLKNMPDNVHLLTFEPWKDGTLLLRLEHYLQKTDDPLDLSKSVTVDLEELLPNLSIDSVKETTLAANQWKGEANRLKWKFTDTMVNDFNQNYPRQNIQNKQSATNGDEKILKTTKKTEVTLSPMEIKTFVIKLNS